MMGTHALQVDRDSTGSSSGKVTRLLEPVLVAFVAIGFQLPIYDRWFSSMDEGHVLLFSDLVAKGGDLYRDATLYPLPGAFYLLAQFFKVFGASILLTRWIVLFEFAAFVVMLFLLMRRVVSRRFAWLAVFGLLTYRIWAFPHWHVYSYSTTSLLVVLIAVTFQLRYFDTRRLVWLCAAGLAFGFSVYCKQDYGAAALLVMSFTLAVWTRSDPDPDRRGLAVPLGVFVGSGAAVGACVGVYFLAQGILADLLQQTILNHMRGIGTFEYTTYPPLFPLFAQEPGVRTPAGLFAFFPGIVSTVDLETLRQNALFQETFVYDLSLKIFYWGPYAFIALAVVRLLRNRGQLRTEARRPAYLAELLLASFSVAFLLLLTLNRPQDFLHLAVLYWPLLCLAVVYFEDFLSRKRSAAWILLVVLAVPIGAVLGYCGRAYVLLHTQNSELVSGERAGIYVKPSEAQLLADATGFLRSHAGEDETVAVLPYFPILHFLADRVGPHRSAYIVWPFAEFEDRDRRIIDAMEAKGTDTVVYNFTQFLTFPTMREFAPELYAYLVEHFETERVFTYDNAGFMLAGLRRVRDASAEGAVAGISLLDGTWERTEVWVGSEEGPPRAISPEERARFAVRELWPFRPVLALRPSSGGRRTCFSIPLEARAGDVLRTAVGFDPERWFVMPAYAARFELAVVHGGGRDVVYERRLDPHLTRGDRRWFDVDVALDPYAGEKLRIELSVAVDAEAGESLRVGGWAEPRLFRLEGTSATVAD